MAWGFMAGLGEGLQQFGGMISKNALQKKLEDERAAREEANQIRREERQQARALAQVDRNQSGLEQDAEGVWWQVNRNMEGNELERKLAPKNKIDEINREQQKDKVTLDTLLTKQKAAELELRDYDEDRALDKRYKEAQIKSLGDTGLARLISAGNSGSGGSADVSQFAGDPVGAVREKYKDLIGEYQQGSAALSGAEVDAAINRTKQLLASSWASRDNPRMAPPSAGDIRSVLTQALEETASKKRKTKGSSSDSSNTGTSLTLPMKK